MRRVVLLTLTVAAMLLTVAAPVAASPGAPFRESGTSKYLTSWSVDCVPAGNRTTCTETGLDAFSISPTEVVVCVYRYSYSFNERTGRGRFLGSEDGCSEPVPASALDVTVSRDSMTATLADTEVTLFNCNQRRCTAGDTVTVSASDSGGPVARFSHRGSFRDGTCSFRYSQTGYSAPVSGTLTIDGVVLAEEGYAELSQYTVQEKCG